MAGPDEPDNMINKARAVDAKGQRLVAAGDQTEQQLEAARRNAAVHGLTNAQLAGYQPSPEFIADVQAWIAGTLTTEQITERVVARDEDRRSRGDVEEG